MDYLAEFRSRVEAFLQSSGMSARDFGKKACNDASFVFDMRDGREPRASTMSKVDTWMKQAGNDHSPRSCGQRPAA